MKMELSIVHCAGCDLTHQIELFEPPVPEYLPVLWHRPRDSGRWYLCDSIPNACVMAIIIEPRKFDERSS